MTDPFGPNNQLGAAMLAQRRVMLSGAIDSIAAADIVTQLMYLDGVGSEPVSLVVNSRGGALDDATPLIDTLMLMRAPVTIDVLGQALGSAGLVVATNPGRRRVGATASVSLRLDVAQSMAGSAAEIQTLLEHHGQIRASVAQQVASRTGQDVQWVLDEFDSGGFFNAAAAVEVGLVDEIR